MPSSSSIDSTAASDSADTTTSHATTETEESADDVSLDMIPGQNCDGYAVVYADDFTADDNEDVANLSGVTCVEGSLLLRMDVTDLTPLASLEATGFLLFEAPDLASLDGLENLQYVRNTLSLGAPLPDAGCVGTLVTTIAPFAGLQEVGALSICDNPNLTSLMELGTALSGDFAGPISIGGLPSLESLAGFEDLTSAGHRLGLTSLPLVPDLQPLGNLTHVEGALTLGGLDEITSMEGLEQVTYVGSLVILENAQLTTLAGFGNLMTVGDSLSIHDNPMLPQDEAEAWAAGLDVGTTVTICNNLGGPPC